MIWMAWRQFRAQAAVVFGALAVLAVVVLVTGLRLGHWYDASGIPGCSTAGDCDTLTSAFTSHYTWLQTLLASVLMLFLPAVIGVFWGAPLIAREFDTGTYQLAWTQSVTRTRWLAAKVVVAGTASIAASGLLSWLVTWWFTPIDNVSDNKFDPTNFSERDIVPLGYAAFAFALGLVAITSSRITDPSGHSVSAIRITPNDPCIANHSCLAGYHQTMT
jgi:ABC-2 family transporter protein